MGRESLGIALILTAIISVFVSSFFNSDFFIVKKFVRIENGKVETFYRLKMKESVPINSIKFVNSIYKKAIEKGEVVDLNVVLKVNNELIKPCDNPMLCLWIPSPLSYDIEDGKLILRVNTVVDKKPTKIELLIFSGQTLIGYKILRPTPQKLKEF